MSDELPQSRLGDGVPRRPKAEKEPEPAPEIKEEQNGKGQSIWSDTPTFIDQFMRYNETCRIMPLQVETFDLSDPKDKKKYNALLARNRYPGAPAIKVEDTERNFDAGKYHVFIAYCRIQYKKLLKTI